MHRNSEEMGKLAIVLGVHRSGTSLMSAVLERLGAHLGESLMDANDENPLGFFENEAIVAFNDRLLGFLGGRWDNPLFDGADALRAVANNTLNAWREEAVCLFNSQLSGHPFVAIKDPRICQLLPFWLGVFKKCGYEKNSIFYVHVIRHPMEVAHSQHKRQLQRPNFYGVGSDYMQTVALWMSMGLQALREVESDNNMFFDYSDLIKDPIRECMRLASFMDLGLDEPQISRLCGNLANPVMKHNTVSEADDQKLIDSFPEAREFYLAQKKLVRDTSCERTDLIEIISHYEVTPYLRNWLRPLVPLFSTLLSQKLISHQHSLGHEQVPSRSIGWSSRFRRHWNATILRLLWR